MPRKKPIELLSPATPEIEITHPDDLVATTNTTSPKPKRTTKKVSETKAAGVKKKALVTSEAEPASEDLPSTIVSEADNFSFTFRQSEATSPQPRTARKPKVSSTSTTTESKSTQSQISGDQEQGDGLAILQWRSKAPTTQAGKKNAPTKSASPNDRPQPATTKRGSSRTSSAPQTEMSESPELVSIEGAEEFSFSFRSASAGTSRTRKPGRSTSKGRGASTEAEEDQEPQDIEVDDTNYFESRRTLSAPEPEPEPEPIPITIPSMAPQVIVREGVPTLVKGQKAIPPFFFSVNEVDLKNWTTIANEIKLACEAGVDLIQLGFDFSISEGVDSLLSTAQTLLERTVSINPNALITFYLNFKAPFDWKQRFLLSDQGKTATGPSTFDDAYWQEVEAHLTQFIDQLRSGDFGAHVLGLHLGKKQWKRESEDGYDTSEAAEKAFRKWLRNRYQNDLVTLRAAWFDGGVEFDSVEIPRYAPEGTDGERFVRSSRKQRRVVDYHMFLSDATVQRIRSLASVVKRASEGWFLVGVSYGFTFEWSHPSSCHLALGKLLRAPEVDYISGSPSYRQRSPGGTATVPCPIDSIALNGKLFISDEDFKTSLSSFVEDDPDNPVLNNPQALESAHWRGAGSALSHASGICWCDSFGRGWLNFPGIWHRAALIRNLMIQRMKAPVQNPEAIVFVDERSLAYLVDPNAFLLLVQNVCDTVYRSGLRIGFYLLSDLAHREHFPEAKLYIFLNAWDMRSQLRSAVQSRLQKNGNVLFWLYAAALFDGGRDAMERVREVVGMPIKPQPYFSKSGTVLANHRHTLTSNFPDQSRIGGAKLEPSYFVIGDESTDILGTYMQSGLPSFATRMFGTKSDTETNWTTVFLGEPLVSAGLIRGLGQLADAHVFDAQEDSVNIGLPFLSVHVKMGGTRTIPLVQGWVAYDIAAKSYLPLQGNAIRITASENSTYTFLVGPLSQVEELINIDPKETIDVGELPSRDLNVRNEKEYEFDIPILKFADYVEDALPDDLKEEWLLQPMITFDTSDESETPDPSLEPSSRGRHNRNKRRGGSRDRSPQSTFEEKSGISAFFRKKV